jgi:hypothetical protein
MMPMLKHQAMLMVLLEILQAGLLQMKRQKMRNSSRKILGQLLPAQKAWLNI